MIRRRDFITLVCGTAAAGPMAARAQDTERVRHIGVLMAAAADDPEYRTRMGVTFDVAHCRSRSSRSTRTSWCCERTRVSAAHPR